jgi:hypothetical protein
MQEAIMQDFLNIAEFVWMDIGSFMSAGAVGPLHISAIALMFAFLRLRIESRKAASFSASFVAEGTPSGRLFERQRIPTPKKCPNCAEQLPLLAIICEVCDYNFLAERPGRGQKLLPAPDETSKPEKPVYDLTILHREDLPSV